MLPRDTSRGLCLDSSRTPQSPKAERLLGCDARRSAMPAHDAKVDGRMANWQMSQSTHFPNRTACVQVTVKWHATFHIRFLLPFLAPSDPGHGKQPTDQKNPLTRFKVPDQDGDSGFSVGWRSPAFVFCFAKVKAPSVSRLKETLFLFVGCLNPTPHLPLHP
jgi:hypothetical protein